LLAVALLGYRMFAAPGASRQYVFPGLAGQSGIRFITSDKK
jgi:hypothetical protein